MQRKESKQDRDTAIDVIYNSACPICDAGIKHQKKRMHGCDILWNDVHTNNAIAKELDSDIEFIRQRLHVVDASGKTHIGINAFIALWQFSPGDAWKAKLLKLPVIHQIASRLYNGFAYLLYHYNRWAKHW